jgi:hypothetical protein
MTQILFVFCTRRTSSKRQRVDIPPVFFWFVYANGSADVRIEDPLACASS